jgi:hypothetical protein
LSEKVADHAPYCFFLQSTFKKQAIDMQGRKSIPPAKSVLFPILRIPTFDLFIFSGKLLYNRSVYEARYALIEIPQSFEVEKGWAYNG